MWLQAAGASYGRRKRYKTRTWKIGPGASSSFPRARIPLDSPSRAKRRPEGAQVRMASIPVPPGRDRGIFNRARPGPKNSVAETCRWLARETEETISANYGLVMPAYLPKIVEMREEIATRGKVLVEKFIRHVKAQNDPWEARFARGFAIVWVGALLLAHLKIAPWTAERASVAITELYHRARSAFVSPEEAALGLVQRLTQLMREGKRFAVVEKGQTVSAETAKPLWGVIRKTAKYGRVLAIDLDRLRALVVRPDILTPALDVLIHDGTALPGPKGNATRQLMISGLTGSKRRRYVLFVVKALRNLK